MHHDEGMGSWHPAKDPCSWRLDFPNALRRWTDPIQFANQGPRVAPKISEGLHHMLEPGPRAVMTMPVSFVKFVCMVGPIIKTVCDIQRPHWSAAIMIRHPEFMQKAALQCLRYRCHISQQALITSENAGPEWLIPSHSVAKIPGHSRRLDRTRYSSSMPQTAGFRSVDSPSILSLGRL